MLVDVGTLTDSINSEISLPVNLNLNLNDDSDVFAHAGFTITFVSDTLIKGTFSKDSKKGGRIIFSGEISVSAVMPCSRCLCDVATELVIPVTQAFVPEDYTFKNTIEAGCDEDIAFDGKQIDITHFVCSEVLLHIPMKVCCNDDCKGLCPFCGVNLNEGTCSAESNCGEMLLNPIFESLRAFIH